MYLMVLNDGETYTNLEGCMIVEVPDDYDLEGIEEELKSIQEGPSQMKPGGAKRVYSYRSSEKRVLGKSPRRYLQAFFETHGPARLRR